jgi:hypothetical protein
MPELEELELPELPPLEEEELPEIPPEERRRPGRPRKHRAKARPSTSADSSSGSARPSNPADRFAPAWEKEVRKGYTEALVAVGTLSIGFLPVTGRVTVSRAPDTADALVRLGRTDPRVRQALIAVLHASAFVEIAALVAAMGLAVNVDIYVRSKGKQGINPANKDGTLIAPVALLIGKEVLDAYGGQSSADQQPAPAVEPAAPAGNGSTPWAGVPATPSTAG